MKRKNIILQLGFTFIIILSIHKIACAQQKSNFSFLLGANINNPHQLIENTNNPNDIKEAKAFGSIYLGIIYKNKIQFMLCNEIIESSVKFRNCNDVFLGSRLYFLKDTIKLKPYIETGTILNSYGDNTITLKSVFGIFCGAGLIFKLNKYVCFDLGINYQNKEIIYVDKLQPPSFSPYELKTERYLIKTGLIFKIF